MDGRDALDEVAEELYGVPPEEFVAARTAARDRARAAGDKQLARDVAVLPKPTTAAWVCNLLSRRAPAEVAQLTELGELLRAAQEGLAGDQLRELGRQRNQVVAALTRQARAIAHREGHDVSSAVAEQVEATLRAAVADPDAGSALQAGRLTTALSYTGLGPVDLSAAVAAPARPPRSSPSAAPADDTDDLADARERARQEAAERRARELAQAERDAEEAAAVARDAAAATADAERELTEATDRHEQLRERVEELTAALHQAEQEALAAGRTLPDRERRRDAAARRAATATAIADRARDRVTRLRDEDD
ncbi:hypothetical protein [Modestobacter roseus]|uniref:Uncharacterized protein n=1 Tax=Modestobacter roseus TaxID=1181884 RepID=A0A562ISM2_9ACTN|nr:hypothetical protein [Modestobacter roseus]MQA32631.1 hypothetical protein [Modestobacter roseus]TWH73725.1 hypothetical protein JD78_02249 [Modestobacter roseus]